MNRKSIEFTGWQVQPHHLWDKQWLVLTCGDFHSGKFNSMIVGWGGFGTMWNKPFAITVVRPQRYTYEFMEKYDSFTLSAFSKKYKKDDGSFETLEANESSNKIGKIFDI